ncbi:MAG: hypothetical protein FJ294_04805 [Planctomycetes bacterium]|nr:hypothetical protein [Planctomycetota bacterium]
MGANWKQLRETCQAPVRGGNDVAGLLFGDHASLLFTKLFVDLRISPNYASIGFLACGILGAAFQFGSGLWAFFGALFLVLYYILDCVDGEVARWQGVVNVHWGYFDYLFHMLIKPLAFFGVGVGCHLAEGETWPLLAAFAAAVATLWRKILIEIPGILFLKDVLRKAGASAERTENEPGQASAPAAASAGGQANGFRLGLDFMTLRAILTNFDIGLLLLAVTTGLDASGALKIKLAGHELGFREAWLAYYGVVLPLDFLDYLVTYLRRRHFSTEMTRLLGLAHHFRAQDHERR